VNGVKDVKASYDKANADVTYDPSKTTPQAIAKTITTKTGFKAEAPRANKEDRANPCVGDCGRTDLR
jgi:hypothetical protein